MFYFVNICIETIECVLQKIVMQFNIKSFFVEIKLMNFKQNNLNQHHTSLSTKIKRNRFYKITLNSFNCNLTLNCRHCASFSDQIDVEIIRKIKTICRWRGYNIEICITIIWSTRNLFFWKYFEKDWYYFKFDFIFVHF